MPSLKINCKLIKLPSRSILKPIQDINIENRSYKFVYVVSSFVPAFHQLSLLAELVLGFQEGDLFFAAFDIVRIYQFDGRTLCKIKRAVVEISIEVPEIVAKLCLFGT